MSQLTVIRPDYEQIIIAQKKDTASPLVDHGCAFFCDSNFYILVLATYRNHHEMTVSFWYRYFCPLISSANALKAGIEFLILLKSTQ